MKWYKTLTVLQRINLKDLFPSIVGVDFQTLGNLFSFRERIEIVYQKMKMEGFQID